MNSLRFPPRLPGVPLRVGALAVLTILLLAPSRSGQGAQQPSPESPGRLITASGDAIQTQGAWRLDGRRVIYTDSRGRLASIRTSEVDLDRSLQPEQLAARGTSTPVAVAPSAKAPALVIEDHDVGQWSTSSTAALTETGGAPSDGDAQPPSVASGDSGVELVSWKAIGDQVDRVVIHGTVRNPTRRTVRQIRIRVVLLDERGEEMRSLPARMVKAQLAPGGTSNFQARFGEFVPYSSVDFLIEGNA